MIKMSESEYRAMNNEYNGICIKCKSVAYGETEPDAENYKCDNCGKNAVYGTQQLLIMDYIILILIMDYIILTEKATGIL